MPPRPRKGLSRAMTTNNGAKKGVLYVVSGPSGVGKGTICKALIEQNPDIYLSISATTRPPRPHETDGVHYHFMNGDEFRDAVARSDMLEYAVFCGNYYGTPKQKVDEMLSTGRNVLLEIEVQGAMKARSKYPEGVYIFVLPPSMEELQKRIAGRGTESDELISERLMTALNEYSHIDSYNYILINDDIDSAVKRFEAIITAESCRIERNMDIVDEVKP